MTQRTFPFNVLEQQPRDQLGFFYGVGVCKECYGSRATLAHSKQIYDTYSFFKARLQFQPKDENNSYINSHL